MCLDPSWHGGLVGLVQLDVKVETYHSMVARRPSENCSSI